MKNILFILSLVFILVSCNKDNNLDANFNEFDNIFTNSKKADNFITLSQSNIAGNFSQIDISKEIVDSTQKEDNEITNNFINDFLGRISLNDDKHISISRTQENSKNISVSFGKNYSLHSNNKSGSLDFYVPESIILSNKEEIDEIDLEKPLTINWNPDPINPNGKVVVTLINRGSITNENTIVNIDDISYTTTVDDNGQFIIEQSKLSRFQINNNLDVIIARGNQVYLNNTALTVFTSDLLSVQTK